MADLESERKIIPADADEIGIKTAEAMGVKELDDPIAHYLLINMGGLRGLDGVSLIVWEDQDGSRALNVTNFFDTAHRMEIGSLAAATANLIKILQGRFYEAKNRVPSLRDIKADVNYEHNTSDGDLDTILSDFEARISEDPWNLTRDYVRNRLLSIIATPD